MAKSLNHIAIAVPDLEKAADFYRTVMQCTVSEPQDVPGHGVRVVFVSLENTTIELLGVLGDESPIARFLEKNPNGGIHHICLNTDYLTADVMHATQQGVRLAGDVSIGAHGMPVAFLHPKDCFGTLIEFEQHHPK